MSIITNKTWPFLKIKIQISSGPRAKIRTRGRFFMLKVPSFFIEFSFAGDLERLRRFWLTGTCNPKKEEKKASEPLAPEQFLSAFFILLCGILVCVGLMGLEHAYVKYIRRSLVKSDKSWCFGFISLVSSNRYN